MALSLKRIEWSPWQWTIEGCGQVLPQETNRVPRIGWVHAKARGRIEVEGRDDADEAAVADVEIEAQEGANSVLLVTEFRSSRKISSSCMGVQEKMRRG